MLVEKTIQLALILALIITSTHSVNGPVSNCLGNCKACKSTNPLQCFPLLNATTRKSYPCIPYYSGPSCSKTVNNYFNLYNESGVFLNWSLPSPPPYQNCTLILPDNTITNTSFPSIGPFSSTLSATKTLLFSQAMNIQKLIVKISVAVADSSLYHESYSFKNETTTQVVDEQGNVVIQTISVSNSSSTTITSTPFLSLIANDRLTAALSAFSASYETISSTNTSCGYVYQYQFVIDSKSSLPFRQLLLTFSISQLKPQTTWYLLSFSAEGGCSGFSVLNQGSCSACLTGFYPTFDPDGILNSCTVCDYRCNTCSSATQCLLCEAYTTSTKPGTCQYPAGFKVYKSFDVITGSQISLKTDLFSSFVSSQSQSLNLGLYLQSDKSYFIKFYHLYSQNYAEKLSQLNITVNGKPINTYSALDTLSSTLMQQVNNGQTQLFYNLIKIDLIGKPCLRNFTIGIKGSSQANEEFYVANLVLVQYSCGQNCLDCNFNPSLIAGGATCTKCAPFFNLAQNCKTCANGFFLRDTSVCIKCYSNCKQCIDQGPRSCTDCLEQFQLDQISYNATCTNCLFNFVGGAVADCNSACPKSFTLAQLKYDPNCEACLNGPNNPSTTCSACWVYLGLARGKCQPTPASKNTFYSNDLPNGVGVSKLWQGSKPLSTYNCSKDYINLLGVAPNTNRTQKNASNLTYSAKGLPEHQGVLIVLNIFKIDSWLTNTSLADPNTNQIINIKATSPKYQGSPFTIAFTNSFGGNICGGDGNEMIWTVQANFNDHTGDQINLSINAPDQGIFVRELQVYLGNCANCGAVGLSFALSFIPMYSDNNTQTGLDVWVTFNHQVYFNPQANQTYEESTKAFANSFSFFIDGNLIPNPVLLQNRLPQFNYLKYFLPLNKSYVNATLSAVTSKGDLVYTQEGSVSRQLTSSMQSVQVQRYDNASLDTRRSISQLSSFFHFFTWFCLIVMIVCVMLGVGVVFQEFSNVLQLIYLHIYITSAILPPSIKIPLSNASRIQHLNYFANIGSIQNSLFGDLIYPGDKIFKQYNVDVYFLRSFYPIMIINAIYIGWFIINYLIYRFLPICKNSDHKVIRFMRSIPQRPLAYFDQIWRYQFLTTMWACMLQFTNFNSNFGSPISLVICVFAFAVSLIWPFVVTIYTYRSHFTMNVNHFRYLYHDIYYLKISSVADEPKFYLYVCVRFGKAFLYTVFIALFINQNVIGPVILLLANLIEAAMAYFIKIYRSPFYLFTRITQNVLLTISAILCLVIFGFSSSQSMDHQQFQNLGYGLAVVFVLMIINAIGRFFYLCYKKINEWRIGTYDLGEVGQKENYDDKNPIKIPQSQRFA